MGRPRMYTEPRRATAVRLPESVYLRVRQAADERDVSVNLLIVKALSRFLDQLPPTDAVLTSDPNAGAGR